jgi:hypothetical protein|tara:strand:+ start:441 stop:644 length:204 start_codon:yes stop_codon:yes gene_type:complete
MLKKCPIYNATNACDVNPNCLFLRDGGCAIVLAGTIAEENKGKISQLKQQLDTIEYNVRSIADSLER